MKPTLSDYADLIIGNVYAGYKGVGNIALSKEAVMTEVNLTSRRIIAELLSAQRLEKEEFMQEIHTLELEQKEGSPEFFMTPNRNEKVYHAHIPSLLWMPGLDPVSYIGTKNRFEKYIVATGNRYMFQKYSKYHSKLPIVLIQGNDLFILNNKKGVKQLLVRAMFENPLELIGPEDPYPVPLHVGDMIVTKLSDQFIRHFRMKNPQPNTQNDIMAIPQQNNEE